MVDYECKKDFISFLRNRYVKTNLVLKLIRELNYNKDLLERVVFSKEILEHAKYSIYIDNEDNVIIKIDGKFYYGDNLIRSILKVLKNYPECKLNIVFNKKNKKFNKMFDNVCHSMQKTKELINECIIDSILNEVEKKRILKLIDKALDENDCEEFDRLMKQYKEI